MPEEKHRVVVDTNLWISFLLTRNFTRLDQLIMSDRTVLLISQELLEEIVEVAERPKFRKYFDLSDLIDFLVNLKLKAELVHVSSQVNVCRDDKDNFLLSLAVDGSATHILTGDKDLLVLHPFSKTQILTVTEYFSV
ncbi:putative toxin-antitoxin system toxin component, PIN family [Telluribacter humicola]|uniref:putative toxin-antitoxin system toxin component, PIN family n=1 Tax=Telluribacter humicola TaxID=1720261 RepID=UPI001A9782EE|nr:putative toxin-antitoxin system toxin component, PIN family [Telluribacter humicola]